MNDEKIIELIDQELKMKNLPGTDQYLEVHNAVYENGKLQIIRIDKETDKKIAVVYFPVEEEKFYFKAYVNLIQEFVISISTEPYHRVYFCASSETLKLSELTAMTKLIPTEFWDIGDNRKHGNSKYNFSYIKFLPNSEPDTFENKLEKLLIFLEQDKKGILNLVEKANGYIRVAIDIHDANGMLGGPFLSQKNINRMSDLKLAIDFDLYTAGNPLKERDIFL